MFRALLDKSEGPMSVWLNLEVLPDNDLKIPEYATKDSAGLDFAACLTRPCKDTLRSQTFYTDPDGVRSEEKSCKEGTPKLILQQYETLLVSLGFKCQFNEGYVLQIYPRSSMGIKGMMLGNSVGIIDSDYRGELFACIYNRNPNPIVIEHGQRIVQGVLVRCDQAVIKLCEVNTTKRGEGGFGSTGH